MKNILEKINEASLKLLTRLTPEETYETIVNEAKKLVNAEVGSIFLERHGTLERVYASMPVLYQTKVRKRGYTYRAYKSNEPSVLSISKIAKIHPDVKERGIKATIFIPLSYRNESIGVLSVDSIENKEFTDEELDVLRLFGSLATLAIRKAQLYDETKKALEIRDMFIAMAAHELRTPLTSINGYIQLLHGKMADKDTAEARWVRELYEESKRMTNLVTELLEVNRIKTGQLQFIWEECDMESLMIKAVDQMNFLHPSREIVMGKEPLDAKMTVIGDATKLLQVISNVLDNAIKYSKYPTRIYITLHASSTSITLSIKDEGKGIDKKELQTILDGHKGTQGGEEGMGLGLFMVDHIIHQHHGTLRIESKLNKGTTVKIKLPRAEL